jgi:hypothetical protein
MPTTRTKTRKPAATQAAATPFTFPAIGTDLAAHGGIFAGIVAADAGDLGCDYALIIGPEHAERLTWVKAVAWAKALKDGGFADFALPNRKEQRLLFANAQRHFQPTDYWSSEQHAGTAVYAWGQSFGSGGQRGWRKDGSLRVRAVRRVPIQSFVTSIIFSAQAK